MIIQKKTLKNVLFIDIETVSLTQHLHELPESLQQLWACKCKQILKSSLEEITEESIASLFQEKAGIFAEFGKIVCISVGYLSTKTHNQHSIRIKSFVGEEVDILKDFNEMLNEHYDDPKEYYLCGHNIREFDVPFICRRSVINGLPLPGILNVAGKKPWHLKHLLDTMQLWKFGDYKNYTSLPLLAGALRIPSPKTDMDGSKVSSIFWEENDIERIATYCKNDVLTVAQIALTFAGLPTIEYDSIDIVQEEPVPIG